MAYELTVEDYRILHQNTVVGVDGGRGRISPGRVQAFSSDVTNRVIAEIRVLGETREYLVTSRRVSWELPKLGMVLLPGELQCIYLWRSDHKQYRKTLLTDTLCGRDLSQAEAVMVPMLQMNLRGPVDGFPPELSGAFNNKYFAFSDAISRLREGEAVSLPLNTEYAVRCSYKYNKMCLNKGGRDVGVIQEDNRVFLHEELAQLREQIEELGIGVNI